MARLKPSRRAAILTGIVVALVVAGVLARHVLVRGVLEGVLSLATGYEVRFGDQRLGFSHAAFFDVRVRKNGDPVLDAARVDVNYVLRDIFPGGERRFGFVALSIQRPVLTITRHADGSLTFAPPPGENGPAAAAPPPATRHAVEPLYFTARLRDGVIRFIDQKPLQPDLATQSIVDVSVDASVKSDARTTARIAGVFVSRPASGAAPQRYPLEIRSLIDEQRGLALTRFRAAALPVRGLLAFLVHTHAVRFDDGVLESVDTTAFALGKPDAEFTYTLGGAFDLRDGQIEVPALQHPIRGLGGTFVLSDTSLTTMTLRGSMAGMPLHGRGALFDLFSVPRFRMAIVGDGDISQLRTLFAFSARLPLSGPAHLETLLAAQLSKPLIRTWFATPRVVYGRIPIEAVGGYADYYNAALFIPGFRARYGAASVMAGGSIDFSARGDDIHLVANTSGAGAALPYTSAFAPDARIDATALVSEPPGQRFAARGTVAATGATSGAVTFTVDQYGVGEFGPFSFSRSDGSSLAGAFELARPISGSAGWLHFRNFRLSPMPAGSGLPGIRIPVLPPLSGTLDGDVAGAGTPSNFGLAGSFAGSNTRVAAYQLGSVAFTLGGSFTDLRLNAIRIDGPLGRFRGDAAYGNDLFAVQGNYDGTLAQLRPFIGAGDASGGLHGPISAAIRGREFAVQTTGVELAGGSVRGIPVARMAGTLLVDGPALRLVAADGTVAGGHAVAGDAGGPFLVSAPSVDAAALRGAGLPLQAGRLDVLGSGDLRTAPRFDGGVILNDGIAGGYPVSGAADLALGGDAIAVSGGSGALGTTYGSFRGRVDGLGSVPAYDLDASVPFGDIATMSSAMRVRLRTLEGSFAANVHVGGSDGSPHLAGTLHVAEGSYNGLAFSGGRANVTYAGGAFDARDGTLTVGSTHLTLAANVLLPSREFAFDVHSADARLSDFDDYFDEADMLDGRGPVAFALTDEGGRMRTDGRLSLHDFRFRTYAFGNTDAAWAQRGRTVSGVLAIHGAHGSLHAAGIVTPARGSLASALGGAAYRGSLDANDVDLNTWLPALGITAPLLGSLNIHATAAGRMPRLAIGGTATLQDGSLYGYAVKEGVLHATSDGSHVAFTNSVLDLDFARFELNGSIGLARDIPLDISIEGETPDLATALVTAFPKGPSYDVGGSVQADVRLTGTISKPHATAGFDITNARYKTLAISRVLGSATYDGSTLEIDDAEVTLPHGKLLIAGSLPLELDPLGIAADKPVSFTLALSSLDLAPFAPFVPGAGTKLGGTVDGRLAIEGTPRAPRIAGDATLVNGSYSSQLDRAGVTAANARLNFQGTSVALEALHAKLGGGTLDGHGSLDLPFPGAHTSGYKMELTARGAGIDSPQYLRGTLDGTLQLASGPTMPILSGDMTLSNASIPFAAITRSAGGGAAKGPPLDLGFDLTLHAGRNVRVQSAIVDVGAAGSVTLTGTLAAPKLDGVLSATPGGIFSTYNRVFRVQEAIVRFNPAQGIVPYVDARAYAHVVNPDPDPTRNVLGSADITVTVRGPADELARGTGITFSSSPPYSQEQIIGLLIDASVFGAVNFGQAQNGTTLRGAPGESNALLPPGNAPNQVGVINFNQEAFSLVNGQFTQRFLAPLERTLGGALNLTDLEMTVDYGGGVGYEALKQIGTHDIYASFGQTLSYPLRTTFGFTARPDATTSIEFNYFTANGVEDVTTNANGTQPFSYVQREYGLQPLSGRQGFTFSVIRKYP